MSIIIRLQNLPWAANALDIRTFFHGLQIPEGGVHIVGGELGDAFIAFSTDEDARQAFLRTDGKIKGIQIKLMLSSRTEMQRVIEQARTQSMAAFMLPVPATSAPQIPAAIPQVMPAAVPDFNKDDRHSRDDIYNRKKDSRRRSRSKSRERRDNDRSRDRRRHRESTRSKSRDRRDSKREGSRRGSDLSRSRDRDGRSRRDRSKSPARRNDKVDEKPQLHPVWNKPQKTQQLNIIPPNESSGIVGSSAWNIPPLTTNVPPSHAIRSLNGFQGLAGGTAATVNFGVNQENERSRESWPPANPPSVRESFDRQDQFNRNSNNNGNNRGSFGSRDQYRENDMRQNTRQSRFSDDRSRDDFRDYENDKYVENVDLRIQLGAKKPRFAEGDPRDHFERRRKWENDRNEPPVDACICVEPFYGSYGDLRRLFQGLKINYTGIKVINDEFGQKTGKVLVQFKDKSNKTDGLLLNGTRFSDGIMRIRHVSDDIFEEAIDKYNPRMDEMNPNDGNMERAKRTRMRLEADLDDDFVCLKVEDLPTYVKEQDILHVFSQHPLIYLHLSFKPKGATIAYVKFSSKEIAKEALLDRSHHVLRGKPLTVRPCTDEEFNRENGHVENENASIDGKIETDCVHVSCLPKHATDRDISDFFSDVGVIPEKIHLISNPAGFTGQAYCEFNNNEQTKTAIGKDGTVLGSSPVSVVPIQRKDMERILQNTTSHAGSVNINVADNPLNLDEIAHPDEILSENIDSEVDEPQAQENYGRGRFDDRRSNFYGDDDFAFDERRFEDQRYNNPRFDGPRPVFPRGGYRGSFRGFRGRGRGGMRFNGPRHDETEEAPPGCTVYIDNIPFKAGTREILNFFEGYNCTNNVSRRYNPNNTPSPEARVTFYNAEDAEKAVRELDGHLLWDRSIRLRRE